MASVTIRRVDDALVEALKALAKANGRSMEEEARLILAQEIARRTQGGADPVEEIRRFQARHLGDFILPESAEALDALTNDQDES